MLLHHSGVVRLCDYGALAPFALSDVNGEEHCESYWYMAPEVLDGLLDVKSDVWSLGISLIEMAEGRNPFEGCDGEELKRRMCDGKPPSLSDEEWSAEFVDFVRKCLVKDVNRRSSVSELMQVSELIED